MDCSTQSDDLGISFLLTSVNKLSHIRISHKILSLKFICFKKYKLKIFLKFSIQFNFILFHFFIS